MSRRWSLGNAGALAVIVLGATTGLGQNEGPPAPLGFAPAARAPYARAEAHALDVPTPEKARSWLRRLTEEPHPAGTEADHKTALFVRDRLREWGWNVEIAEYEVLLNYPSGAPVLELVQPARKKLPLQEAAIAADKDSASPEAFRAFHGYGVTDDVSGQVVYANYGRPEDFSALEKLGIDVAGKIVLVRYGELFRGLKVRNAQKRGAKGILIYSDPLDDGFDKGDVYPQGPFRPGSAIQRGSVQFLSLGPGDPSTPFGPSVKGAKRLPIDHQHGFVRLPDSLKRIASSAFREQTEDHVKDWEKSSGLKRNDDFPNIPSLPIGYDAARPILKALGGPNVPQGWQGGLPFAYHAGPGPAEVQLKTSMDYQVRTIWNVIATIPGSTEPDRWVMIGNHRDAWVYGAVDPGSGTAATLEMCRAIGSAVKQGWTPKRTLVYASWDAEEYGLVGSTEWAEDHASELGRKAVLMLNVDSAVAGTELDLSGIPSLRDLALDAAGAVRDVRSGKTLRQVWTERRRSAWASQGPIEFFDPVWDPVPEPPAGAHGSAPPPRFSPQMGWLGSGSDYTAFVDHLGIPALDAGFHGRYGVYHSIYDDFAWMEKFGDPEFITHAMAARLYTAIAMRAAGADIVPLKFVPYGEALREHVDELRRIVERKGRAAEPGVAKPPISFEGLPRLVAAVRALQAQAAALDQATEAAARRDDLSPAHRARINDALMRIERAFLNATGLPSRPWFKHAIYAPGTTTGYASWPLPGLRQAIQDDDPALLSAQTATVISRLNAATHAMKNATDAAAAPSDARSATR